MTQIFDRFCKSNGYSLEKDAVSQLRVACEQMFESREEHFGNARTVRNLFEKAINMQANRLATESNLSDDALSLLTVDDLSSALAEVAK